MNTFNAKDVNAAPNARVAHEDMGLCWVSMFTVGHQQFYSVVPKKDNEANCAEPRVEQAKKDLLRHGYFWDGAL